VPVRHFLYTSTAVVYGKPLRVPIDEEHPLRVLEARKPAYGIAKEFAEKLTLLAAKERAAQQLSVRLGEKEHYAQQLSAGLVEKERG
jgi:nucleoside-diphosphate-sugar epimerase